MTIPSSPFYTTRPFLHTLSFLSSRPVCKNQAFLAPFLFRTMEDWLAGVLFPNSFVSPQLNDTRWVLLLL